MNPCVYDINYPKWVKLLQNKDFLLGRGGYPKVPKTLRIPFPFLEEKKQPNGRYQECCIVFG